MGPAMLGLWQWKGRIVHSVMLCVYITTLKSKTKASDEVPAQDHSRNQRSAASYMEVRRVEGQALLRLNKVLRSLDDNEEGSTNSTRSTGFRSQNSKRAKADLGKSKESRSVRDEATGNMHKLESAFKHIEKSHEKFKRSQISKALIAVEEHTRKALQARGKTGSSRISGKSHLWPVPSANHRKGGRTVTISTYSGRKRVFIPQGWVFCTISPSRCFSAKPGETGRTKKTSNKRTMGKQRERVKEPQTVTTSEATNTL